MKPPSRNASWAAFCPVLIALFATLSSAPAQQAGDSPVKIFIMVGQSNMLGHGNISPVGTEGTLEYVVANDPGGDYQFVVDGLGDWIERDDVWIKDQYGNATGLTVGYGSGANDANPIPIGSNIGPELGFGHKAGDLYEEQILLVKAAWGGKSLGADFRPPSSGGTTGFYYNETLNLVNDAIANLGTYFSDYNTTGGYQIAGFCWHQGWNDRVSGTFSAEYETNMANFISDIRTDLGVADLPFVIATSAMDGNGPTAYTTVENAQLAMANTTTYPQFDGNVAVVDCRQTYDGLDFWQPVANSPANQGFHWNRNAKTYLNIGIAMADAMSLLTPPRCPSRLRATGGTTNGITLNWQNGDDIPTSVEVRRDTVTIAGGAPGNPATFADTAALPGVYDYELVFTMAGDPCDPLTVTFDGNISDLDAFRSSGGVTLTWTNNMPYDAIEIRRDGVILEATYAGTAVSYVDTSPPTSGLITYSVVPTTGTPTPTEVQINLNAAPAGNALVYEPFDYPTGGLNGQSGISEVGLEGAWLASSASTIAANSLTWGTSAIPLPVYSNSIGDLSGGSNRFGGARILRPEALVNNGLLEDGAILWFSALMGYDTGGNATNSRLALAFGDDQLNTGNFNYWLNGSGTTALGVTVGRFSGTNGKIVATQFRDTSFGDGTAGNVFGSEASGQFGASPGGAYTLVVGKFTWAADPADPDTLEIFNVGTDLAFPTSPISTLQVVVGQTGYNTISWARGDKMIMDEIRFGATYNDAIGWDLVGPPDVLPPAPDPATFATVPTALSDNAITMTATVGSDPSGVEYYFRETSGNPGGSDSGWQPSPTYVDSGLSPVTSYSYQVRLRDTSPALNESGWSTTESASTPAIDFTPPTPNPMTFAVNPAPVSNTGITMTATTATDNIYSVEYLFTNTTIATTSGWQASPVYTEGGLTGNTTYTYTVTARDTGPNKNVGTASGGESATTFVTDDTAPSPNPSTWDTPPTAVSDTSITMTATTATDVNGVEYYFANLSSNDGSHDSGWQDSPSYTDTGLSPFQSYTYRLSVRDKSYAQNEATGSILAAVTDPDPAITTPSLIEGQHYIVASNNNGGRNFDFSVFPGAARYVGTTGTGGPITSSFGDGTPLDYNLFQNSGGVGSSYSAGTEGLVGVPTVTLITSNISDADVWATSAPGTDFDLNPADFTTNTAVRSVGVGGTISGSIDISGMSEGIVYFVYGAYRGSPQIDVTMSGAGQTSLTLDNAGDNDFANNQESYVVAINFLNAGDYDTISYSYTSGSSGHQRWMMGVVLDGTADVSPPATAYSDWAASNGLTEGINDAQTDDADSGGQNNFYEFAFGGDPLAGNDDGALMHVFTADADGDTDADGVLTVLVRAGATWTYSGPAATASVDGVNYTIAGSATLPVSGAVNVLEGTTVITTGLPAAPFGYEYKSFILDGSVSEGLAEGYFQATASPTP